MTAYYSYVLSYYFSIEEFEIHNCVKFCTQAFCTKSLTVIFWKTNYYKSSYSKNDPHLPNLMGNFQLVLIYPENMNVKIAATTEFNDSRDILKKQVTSINKHHKNNMHVFSNNVYIFVSCYYGMPEEKILLSFFLNRVSLNLKF